MAYAKFVKIEQTNPNIIWDCFVDKMKEAFLPSNYRSDIFKRLQKLKQRGDIKDHVENFNNLLKLED
jgi:hypothetical protein